MKKAKAEGKDPETIKWSIPKIPKFSTKKGPLDFIEELWQYEGRELPATLAVWPGEDVIDIGLKVIDLYCYLKTKLWENWEERS